MRSTGPILLLAGLACGWGCGEAAAAAAPSPTPSTQAPAQSSAPNTDVGAQSGTLSDKLSNTGGVIHPQGDVDSSMQKPAPATGTMPVVPPPGTPGGSKDIQPK